uniref:Uncharacterized protein n=1 Tax=Arundo donax TaxID=35708 RepID=A0A0A9GW71_ARUDO
MSKHLAFCIPSNWPTTPRPETKPPARAAGGSQGITSRRTGYLR